MKIQELLKIVNGTVVCGEHKLQSEIQVAFASDLMSDVLTVDSSEIILLTGLANLQTIRTLEMSDIEFVLLVRGKKATPEMISLALENDITILETEYSMFRTSGLLFQAGIKPVY